MLLEFEFDNNAPVENWLQNSVDKRLHQIEQHCTVTLSFSQWFLIYLEFR